MGAGNRCVLTLLERVSGYFMIGKLADKTGPATVERACHLLATMPRKFRTITSDNGCKFHVTNESSGGAGRGGV